MLALAFEVGRDRVAVDVRRVRAVVPRVPLAPPAGGPGWLAGVFVHRGRAVPVVDLHRLAGAGPCPDRLSSRIVLVPFPGAADPDALLGLLASRVADVREVPPAPGRSLAVASAGGADLGPAVADGADVLRILDVDALLPAGALGVLNGGAA